MILCLYFPSIEQKVVFGPTVDLFDALQIKGLWQHFKTHSSGDLLMTAISNGVESRPVVFRKDNLTVPILNLVVELKDGFVSSLKWKNSCYGGQVCEQLDCVDTTFKGIGIFQFPEMNCVKHGCSESDPTCDTQVFVTFVGKDSDQRTCVSDNMRLTGFTDFGVKSYYDAAVGLSLQ